MRTFHPPTRFDTELSVVPLLLVHAGSLLCIAKEREKMESAPTPMKEIIISASEGGEDPLWVLVCNLFCKFGFYPQKRSSIDKNGRQLQRVSPVAKASRRVRVKSLR